MTQLHDYQIRQILSICTHQLYDAYLGDGHEEYTFEEFVAVCEDDAEFKSEFDK